MSVELVKHDKLFISETNALHEETNSAYVALERKWTKLKFSKVYKPRVCTVFKGCVDLMLCMVQGKPQKNIHYQSRD